jgi:hypothetical protein
MFKSRLAPPTVTQGLRLEKVYLIELIRSGFVACLGNERGIKLRAHLESSLITYLYYAV